MTPARSVREAASDWRVRHLLLAPHRLGFFLGTLVLLPAALWWTAVQLNHSGYGPGLTAAVPPQLVHAAVMTFGFMPLFFGGFLFTAVPQWLDVPAPTARSIAAPALAQAAGWLLWLAGSHVHRSVAVAGLVLSAAGLLGMTTRYGRMVRSSAQADRLHARLIGLALGLGCLCLAVVAAMASVGRDRAAIGWVRSGLWGFVVLLYLCVAHRLIPFFTSNALPVSRLFRLFWPLWAMLGVVAFEAMAELLDAAGVRSDGWELWRGGVELGAGAVALWLCLVWGFSQNLKVRWVGMLHLGFLWLGLALVLGGAARVASVHSGQVQLHLGALHALGMGCLGSLMLAMVTRISAARSGRAVRAEGLLTGLFWALQAATLLRIAATLNFWPGQTLLTLAALLWAALVLIWGIRNASWYGRLRVDGRPG
jgi:uncharacterized protein involved in response to NO